MNKTALTCALLLISGISQASERSPLDNILFTSIDPKHIKGHKSDTLLNEHARLALTCAGVTMEQVAPVIIDQYYKEFKTRITTKMNILIGAREDQTSKLVASASGCITELDGQKICQLNYVCVDPGHRKKGIGTRMVEEFNDFQKKTPIVLFCLKNEEAARGLFQKCGFALEVDEAHPDGAGTDVAWKLATALGGMAISKNPKDIVAYMKK